MSLQTQQSDFAFCLEAAQEMLGGPVQAVDLDWCLQYVVWEQLRKVSARGLGTSSPLVSFHTNRGGHCVELGLCWYQLPTSDGPIDVVRVLAPFEEHAYRTLYRFWVVRTDDYRRFYRAARKLARRREVCPLPIMPGPERQRLWDNTIGFLKHGCERLRQYGVPQKRGVLLLGEPGNGKTMACRWVRTECERNGLEWKSIRASDLQQDDTSHVFRLEEPGIIFFDDVDMALRQRDEQGTTPLQSTFLGGLDGMEVHTGTVFLFTSNAEWSELDAAFRRPGRIDVLINFPRPPADLRLRMFRELWHADIRAHVAEDEFVTDTAGLSFAEIDELKKLLVLHQFETGDWDWGRARGAFADCRRAAASARTILGFAPASVTPAPALSAVAR